MAALQLSNLQCSLLTDDLTALNHIPAMQRRRLSALAKLALNSAMQVLKQQSVDYIVWVSQYGDEHKTYKILEDVLQQQTPSPTQFSTSVHNAIAGLYSILMQDATPSTSLSASWTEALFEAYAYLGLHAPNGQALVVYYENPLPEIYLEHQDFTAFSLAAVVSLQQPNLKLNLQQMTNQKHKYLEAQDFQNFWHNSAQSNCYVWQKC